MATRSYHQIRATMAVCLKDAEEMFDDSGNATGEDIRSTAISMAIEVARSGAEPSARMRFLAKFYENLEIVGIAETGDILALYETPPAEEIIDLREMALVTRAMIKKIDELKAANAPANEGEEA